MFCFAIPPRVETWTVVVKWSTAYVSVKGSREDHFVRRTLSKRAAPDRPRLFESWIIRNSAKKEIKPETASSPWHIGQ